MKKLLLSITAIFCLSITSSFAQRALSFGSNNTTTYVTMGNPSALRLSQFTIECWFKRTGTGVTASTGTGGVLNAIPLITKGTSENDGSTVDANYFLGINTSANNICADFEEGATGTSPGLNHPITGTTVIANNVWYHAAATYDGTTWKLYLNGLLEGTLVVGQPCQNLSIQHASIGSSIRSNGTTAQGFFAGVIDEARIWNSARTLTQIQSTVNSQLYGAQSGMVGRWALNEVSGSTARDSSGNASTGTINGTNFTWTTGAGNIAPFNLTFAPVNYAPTIVSNSPANGNKCLDATTVGLNVTVNDQNVTDALTVKFYGRPKKNAPADFTIIGLPDTQFYTQEANGGSNAIFKAQTNWIVSKKDSLKIVHVSQLGDCVQNGDNGGNDIEWKRADTSMAIIENPLTTNLTDGIPYTMNVGNHDQSPAASASGTTTFFNQYFGTARFTGRGYWGGNYGSNADNSYQLFSANGIDFIAVSLEYDETANAAVLAWANGLLQTYSNRKAIIVSHWIINSDGTFGAQGQAIYNALKANTNLFLMLCGHINPNGEARRADTFGGNTVNTLLSDYQDINGGNGWLRIMTFSPANNTLSVKTYSPTLNQFQTDANSQFTLTNMNFTSDTTVYQLLSTQTVTGSGTLNYDWSGLAPDSMYEWYATVADTQYTTSTSVDNFGTYSKPVVSLGSDITEQCDLLQALDAGNPGKTFLWSTGATTQTITPNSSGTFSVTVTNLVSGCTGADTIVVVVTGKPVATITPNITNNCSGGTAILTATAGMAGYSWSTGETTDIITTTVAGTYSVTITNAVGCTASTTQTVAFAPQLSASTTVTNVSCFGGRNGAVTLAVTGSATYAWNNGATTQNISGLSPNTYSVLVTDNGGCTTTATGIVTQPAAPLSLTAATITTSNGGYNATIRANPAGGTPTYVYSWRYNNAGANITTQTLNTSHVGGIYSVTVTDSKGCTVAGTYSLTVPTVASATVLLPWSSAWKYKDDGSNLGTAWRGTAFDDSPWSSGQGEFGYGDGDESSLMNACGTVAQTPSCTNKYITTYFRKTINISDVNQFATIRFNSFRDDGIIVYANNTELYRSNMPSTTVTYTTGASSGVADDGETLQTQTLTVAASALVTGNNTIAVEVHQQIGTSSDVTFNMEILGVPPVPEVLTRGPYLQKLTPSSVTIRWNTDQAVKSQINYGTDSTALNGSIVDNANVTTHSMTLTGLLPYTKYYYRIGSPTLALQGSGQNFFITSPVAGTPGKYNFWLVGDCGNNSTNQAQVRDAYNKYMGSTPTNAWMLLGDNAYSSGTDAEYQAEFFNVYQGSIMKNAPLYPSPGNHDYSNGNTTRQDDHNVPYYTLFDMPSNGEAGGVPSGKKEFYSYDYGNVHFLSLDSYGEESNLRLYDTLGAQVQWIKQDLAANTNKQFVVAYWHHPPYTMGSHNSDTESELTQMHTKFIQILERYGVDLIVCGHSHEYERSKLMKGHYGSESTFNAATHDLSTSSGRYDGSVNSCTYVKDSIHGYNGTIYVVSGSAGQLDPNVQTAWPHNAMNGYNNQINGGSTLLTVEGNRLDLKWICADDSVRDQFTLIKDANKVCNYTINYGQSVGLTASWKGQYFWSQGSTSSAITVSPTANTTYVATDQYQCVADTFKVTVIMPDLTLSSVPDMCAGTSMNLGYTISGSFNPGNVFTVQLSDASGNFANADTIGTIISTVSDSIQISIPANKPTGTHYLIRVLSSDPVTTSSSSNEFVINDVPTSANASDNSPVCAGADLNLTSSAVGAISYSWSGSDNFSSASQNPVITGATIAAAGTYTVIASNVCGSTSASVSVLVNDTPAQPSAFTTSSANVSQGQVGIVYAVTNNLAVTYSWTYSGTGATINGSGNSVTVDFSGSATSGDLSVFAIGSCGTSTPRTIAVTLSAPTGIMRITEYEYNGSEFVEFTNVGAYPVDMNGWSYDDNSRTAGSFSLSTFGIVQAGESVILSEEAASAFRTRWGLCNNLKIIGGSNQNLGRADEINLYNASNTLVDRLTFDDQTLGGPRTDVKSAWVPAAALGTNSISLWIASTAGDAEGSFTSTIGGFIASPGKSTRATIVFDPCFVPNGAPAIVLNVSSTTNYLDGGASVSPSSPYGLSGVIGDPTDPASIYGIDFTINDDLTPVNSLTVTATSSNTSVVPNANLVMTGTGASRNVKIIPNNIGYSNITITVNDGAINTSYVINYAASDRVPNIIPENTFFHTGMSDGSDGIPLDDNYYITGDDELDILNVYSRNASGLPLVSYDYHSYLNLPDPSKPEVDVEAATRSNAHSGRVYWTGSMSNGKLPYDNKPNRDRLFATTVTGTGAATSFAFDGYVNIRTALLAWGDANGYAFTASAAPGVDSKSLAGFSLEGMVFGPNGTTLYLSLRAPLVPVNFRHKAVIAPLLNFEAWFNNGAPVGAPTFGAPIELDLDFRGIRDIIRLSNGTYILVAGSPIDDGGVNNLYKWTGFPGDAPLPISNSAGDILNIEGLMQVNDSSGLSLSKLQIISDGGAVNLYADGNEAKDFGDLNLRKFRSDVLVDLDLSLCSGFTASVTAAGNDTLCGPDSLVLTAPAGMTSYAWSNGATTSSIVIKSAGNYSVSVVNSHSGCSATSSTATVVQALPADFNRDGVTDNADFLLLLGLFNQSCSICPEDINKDGIVTNIDFLFLLGDFNKTCH